MTQEWRRGQQGISEGSAALQHMQGTDALTARNVQVLQGHAQEGGRRNDVCVHGRQQVAVADVEVSRAFTAGEDGAGVVVREAGQAGDVDGGEGWEGGGADEGGEGWS